MSIFPKHPFPMETIFQSCFLVNFGMDPKILEALLPPPIKPDTYNEEAFLSIVISDLRDMRPTFVPKSLGFNFNQIVYRAIVKRKGERGVHFLRSDANNKLMCLAGNLFSFFHFNYAEITSLQTENFHSVEVKSKNHEADIKAEYDISKPNYEMPGPLFSAL